MQPRPMAETSRLLFPSLRFCIVLSPSRSGPILFVTDLFHPVDRLAVELFHDGDMRHRRHRRCAMPMLLAGRAPDHIAGPDFLFGFAPTLRPAAAGRDEQCLPERVRVPCSASTGLECHADPKNAAWIGSFK